MREVLIGDCFERIKNGYSISNSKDMGGIPITRIETIANGEIDFNKVGYADIFDSQNHLEYLVKKDDILMSHINSVSHLGKVAFCEFNDPELIHGMNLLLLRTNDKLDSKYAFYFFKSTMFSKRLSSIIKKAVNQASFSISNLKNLQIPLPPLPIQRKIAEALDKADSLRKRSQQILAKYDQLAQSVFLEMFGDPVKNEKGWEEMKLGQLGDWQSGGTPSRSKPEYFKGDIPWLSSGELNEMYLNASSEKISEEALKNSAAKLIPVGSLLLGMYDTAALKSTITSFECTCNQAISFAKLNEKIVNTGFVYFTIQVGKEHFKRLQRGVRQKNLNLKMIKSIKIFVPPISLQNQFSSIITQIEKQKSQTQVELDRAEELYQSLLQKAFSGELFNSSQPFISAQGDSPVGLSGVEAHN